MTKRNNHRRTSRLAPIVLAISLAIPVAVGCATSDEDAPASCADITLALARARVAPLTAPVGEPGDGASLSEAEAERHAKQIAQATEKQLRATCDDFTDDERTAVASCLGRALSTDSKTSNKTAARCLALR